MHGVLIKGGVLGSTVYRHTYIWRIPTLPEGEEYDGLDGEKLEHGVILGEQFSRGWVEEDQAVEGDSDGEVVGKGAVEVTIPRTVCVCVCMSLRVKLEGYDCMHVCMCVYASLCMRWMIPLQLQVKSVKLTTVSCYEAYTWRKHMTSLQSSRITTSPFNNNMYAHNCIQRSHHGYLTDNTFLMYIMSTLGLPRGRHQWLPVWW